jgi:hypothetical protein
MALLSIGWTVSSCTGIADNFDKYLKSGEDLHVGKMDSLYLYPGKLRAQLKCWVNDARSTEIGIKCKNDEDYKWYDINVSTRLDPIILMIDNLEEGSNEITFVTANADKSVISIPIKKSVTVYGSKYQAILSQRGIKSITSSDGDVNVLWGARSTSQLLGEEVTYTKTDGKDTIMVCPAADLSSHLINAQPKGSIKYRSLFMPVSSAIDTFYVEATQVEYAPASTVSPVLARMSTKFVVRGNLDRYMNEGLNKMTSLNTETAQAAINGGQAWRRFLQPVELLRTDYSQNENCLAQQQYLSVICHLTSKYEYITNAITWHIV